MKRPTPTTNSPMAIAVVVPIPFEPVAGSPTAGEVTATVVAATAAMAGAAVGEGTPAPLLASMVVVVVVDVDVDDVVDDVVDVPPYCAKAAEFTPNSAAEAIMSESANFFIGTFQGG